MHFLLISWMFTFYVMANIDLYPKHECELFNNLKHSKNRGAEVLKLDRSYEMLQHHKGQYLLKVEYAVPSQRWVDDDCLTLRPLQNSPLYVGNNKTINKKQVEKNSISIQNELDIADINMAKNTQNIIRNKEISSRHTLLALSWHNAFCETHRYKKECKRGLFSGVKNKHRESHFVLHGLWPQPKSKMYCDVNKKLVTMDKHKQWNRLPKLELTYETRDALKKFMPGYASNLHKHEWVKHGTCYGTNVQEYYSDAIHLTQQVNQSKVGNFFSKHIGKTVTLKQVRYLFDSSFGVGAGKRVEMKCRNGLITQLWLHLGKGSIKLKELLKNGKITHSRCQKGRIDKAGIGR